MTPSNTPIPQPTPMTTQKRIRISSAILPQYTFRTDRHTDTQRDRWARRQVRNMSASLAVLIESDALIISLFIPLTFTIFIISQFVVAVSSKLLVECRLSFGCQRLESWLWSTLNTAAYLLSATTKQQCVSHPNIIPSKLCKCWLGDNKDILPVKILVTVISKVLFHNRYRNTANVEASKPRFSPKMAVEREVVVAVARYQ